jgi:predicted MPP superfamily phosphohydrolase
VSRRIALAVLIIQSILLLIHFFLYETWLSLFGAPRQPWLSVLQIALVLLSVSFVAATLLAHRFFNRPVRVLYRIASVWLGFVNFAVPAACLAWIVMGITIIFNLPFGQSGIAVFFVSLALLATLYGLANAATLRIKRVTVKLPGLPPSWRGRVAALVTDTHLGHIKGRSFIARIVTQLRQLRADVVFIAGDMFDGTHVDAHRLVAPWKQLSPKFGSYFVTGNHDEFSNHANYLDAIRDSGIRVLHNETVNLDGLQVLGVPYHDSAQPERFRSILANADLDPARASVLLSHVPHSLPIPEKQGISLQLSGHTHGGQIFPFTWFTSRIFGAYTYGLKRFGDLLVYTSSGAGTWGPPMRVCTQPEIVLIHFE